MFDLKPLSPISLLQAQRTREISTQLVFKDNVFKGESHFDIEPEFPCFALFIGQTAALLIKPASRRQIEFVRIDIARFSGVSQVWDSEGDPSSGLQSYTSTVTII
jgi:hypothetical protein